MLDTFARSLLDGLAKEIDDRIAFILVRDGISRKALRAGVEVDFSAPYYAQKMTPGRLLIETADFLGVSVEWLLTGKGRNTREAAGAGNGSATYTKSAALIGNRAEQITVYNYSN